MNKNQRWKGIMKCYPFEEKRLLRWTPPYIVQPKYDGIRCKAIPLQTGEYMLISSEENPIFSVPHINSSIKRLCTSLELDAELYCHGMSFEEILSIVSRTKNLHPDHKLIKFHMFDVVNEQNQLQRTLLIDQFKHKDKNIEISPFYVCETLEGIKRTYDKLINAGYEGIIIRNIYAPYEMKRSTWVMKFKPKKKDTYKIVGYNEEISKDGKPKGRIGSIICESQLGDTFNVSAGLDDDDKERLWLIREELPGKEIVVHYQSLTNRKIPRGTFNVEVL